MDFGCDLYVFLAKFCQTRQLTENYDEHYSDYLQPPGIPALILLQCRVPLPPLSSPQFPPVPLSLQDCKISGLLLINECWWWWWSTKMFVISKRIDKPLLIDRIICLPVSFINPGFCDVKDQLSKYHIKQSVVLIFLFETNR